LFADGVALLLASAPWLEGYILTSDFADFRMLSALLMTAKNRAPVNEPKSVPSPPFRLVPPITTTTIAVSSFTTEITSRN
jgi:hypothetical protein